MNTKGMKFLMAVAVMAMLFVSVCLIPSSEEYDAADAILVDEASDFGTATSNQITLAVDNTYKLTADVDLGTDALFAEGVTITIDLNGFELKSSHTVYVICSSGSTLSIIDSGTDGKITSTAAHGIHLANGGALSITGIDIEAAVHGINMDSASTTTVSAENSTIKAGAFGIEAAGSGAIELKTGTTIDATQHGVHVSASSSNAVTFAGLSITAKMIGAAIYNEGTGAITVTNGDLTGASYAILTGKASTGIVTISTTGTLNGGVNGIQLGDDGTTLSQSSLVISNATVEGARFAILSNSTGTVQIDSGKIKSAGGQDDEDFGGYAIAASKNTTGLVTINGGEFSSEGAGIFDSAGKALINADLELSGHVNDLTISAGKTVTVPEGKVFEIKSGEKLSIVGTLKVEGTVDVSNAERANIDGRITLVGDGAKIVGDIANAGGVSSIVLDDKFTLVGSKNIDLSGYPVIEYNGKTYVIFKVDFGGQDEVRYQTFGILKVAVPYTGEPINQEDVTVAGTSFADGQTMKSITFTELPGDEDFDDNFHAGASHTYKTKISTAYNGDSQYFSVAVPYEVTQVDSEVVFSEYDETTVEGIEIDKIMPGSTVEMPTDVAHKVIITAEVKYYSGDDVHKSAGYYIVAKVASADPEKVTLDNAKYFDPISKEWKSLEDGYILAYIGSEFSGELDTTVDIDLDGPEGCAKDETGEIYDDYKATTYTVQLILSEDLGIELIPITDDNLTEALKFTDLEDLYGKLPKDLQTGIKFTEKAVTQDAPATADVIVKDIIITGMLKYVYNYNGWDTDAKGYFLPYYIALPEGKEWKDATVTFEKDGSVLTYNPEAQADPKTFDGFMVIKVTKPGITQKVTIEIDEKEFIWNLKFDAFDAETGEELLTFEPAATYEAVTPENKTVFGITLDDITDKTFYMVFMNTIKSDLTINLYYLGNKTEKEEGAVPVYTEDKSKLDFWAEKEVGMYIWYASFEYQLKDIDCKGGNYLIEVLGEKAATEQEEAKDVLVAKTIAVVSGQESKVDFAHVNETDLYGKKIEEIVDGELAFEIGTFVPTGEKTGYYPVNVTGKIHYVKEYTGYSSKAYYQSGFYLPFDILIGGVDISAEDYPKMTISLEALQGPRPFVADDLDGIFVVFIGKDSSKFPEITVKIDLDGNDAVFKETTYVLSLAPVDGEGGVTVGNLDIILVDEANEVLTFNIPEGKYFKLPNGKDNNKKFDAWNLEKDTYSDESVYVVSYNDVTTEGEFEGKVVFTATYKEIEPVPPQPTKNDSAVDLAVIIGENSAKVNIYGANGLLVPEGKIIITYKTWADRNGFKYLKNETKEITVLGGTSIVNTLESFDLDNVKCFKVSYESNDDVPVKQNTAWQML